MHTSRMFIWLDSKPLRLKMFFTFLFSIIFYLFTCFTIVSVVESVLLVIFIQSELQNMELDALLYYIPVFGAYTVLAGLISFIIFRRKLLMAYSLIWFILLPIFHFIYIFFLSPFLFQ